MTSWILITMLSITAVPIGKSTQDDVSAELKKLRGAWTLIEEIDDGKPMPGAEASKNKLTFDGEGNWKVEIDGKVVGEGTATIDPNRKPKTIDYTFTRGESPGAKFIAIYELSDDLYKHCGVLTGTRPTEFSSKPGSKQILTTFRRVAKD
jgi:uncharacterized protein (TIGR03067 family)